MTLDRFIEELGALPVKWAVIDDQIRTDSAGDDEYCPIVAVAVHFSPEPIGFDVDKEVNDEYELAAGIIGLDMDVADHIVAASDRPAPVAWAPYWDAGLRKRLLAATGLEFTVPGGQGRGPPWELVRRNDHDPNRYRTNRPASDSSPS